MSLAASLAGVVLALLVSQQPAVPQAAPKTVQVRLPARIEEYLATIVRPTPAERKSLLAGQSIAKLVDGDPNSEVAVFGGVWINAPIQRYIQALHDIENFEKGGGFHVTKRISPIPHIDDFSAMRLPAEDVKDLRNCRVGDCKIKLSAEALKKFQTEIDWRAPNRQAAADTMFRQLALSYVNGYLDGGNEKLAIYRDSSRPTLVAQEFRSVVERTPAYPYFTPELRRFLLEYPKAELPRATSFLYWQDLTFGLKSTLRISHLSIREDPDATLVASKMLYATHYFWTALELRVLVPDPSRGNGFWFFALNRSRADGLTGFIGTLLGGRIREGARKGVLASVKDTKIRLER